ncbi:unnamed protein product [Orchesella dallaii]|uniref:Uncharacterized protein n=1 Tax=Orchesella dallaii TaxID=48710 RepID=A0ABP1R344_9HEXA
MASNPCCCMTLKTGGFVIAILEIVLGVLSLVATSLTLGGIALIKSFDNGTILHNITEQIQKENPGLYGENIASAMSVLTTVLCLLVAYSVMEIIMGSVLVHGVRTERLGFLKGWMIYKVCGLALSLVLNISVAWLEPKNQKGVTDILSTFVGLLLGIYFIYVIYRLYIEMRDGSVHRPKPKYEFS